MYDIHPEVDKYIRTSPQFGHDTIRHERRVHRGLESWVISLI